MAVNDQSLNETRYPYPMFINLGGDKICLPQIAGKCRLSTFVVFTPLLGY